MAFGFQAINSTGNVQIDDAYRNLRLVASGTWTGYAVAGTINFPVQSTTSPLIFFRPSADGVYVGNAGVDASSFGFQCNGSFDWKVYGLDNTIAPTGSHGMQVFDSASRVVFDSRIEVPRIQTVLTTNQVWPSAAQGGASNAYPAYPYTLTFTSWGSRPWICLNSLFFYEDEYGTSTCATTSGLNSVILRCGAVSPGPVPAQGTWQWAASNAPNNYSHPYGQVRIPIAK